MGSWHKGLAVVLFVGLGACREVKVADVRCVEGQVPYQDRCRTTCVDDNPCLPGERCTAGVCLSCQGDDCQRLDGDGLESDSDVSGGDLTEFSDAGVHGDLGAGDLTPGGDETLTGDSEGCPPGTTFSTDSGLCRESACADGWDNDDNGLADYDGWTQGLVLANEGVGLAQDPACEVSLLGVLATPSATVEGLQVMVECDITTPNLRGILAMLGSSSCLSSGWSGSTARFVCVAPNVADGGSGTVSASCSSDPTIIPMFSSGGVSPIAVVVCGKDRYVRVSGTGDISCPSPGTSCATMPNFQRSLDGAVRWSGPITETPYGAGTVCCPPDHCVLGSRCYPEGSTWQAGNANGPWTGEPLNGWICGDYGNGLAMHKCSGVEAQYSRVGSTFEDRSTGQSFCCSDFGNLGYRFTAGSCVP